MKKILFISYDGLTDPLGQSQIIPYLVGLSKHDYQFTILSCEKPGRFSLHKEEIENQLKSFSIKWVPILYHKNPPVLSSVWDVYQLKKKAKELYEKEKFDMVHTRPGIPSLVGLWMKNNLKIKFLNDIREFYADSRVDGKIWNQKQFLFKKIYQYFKQKENEAVTKSDGIVCLTYEARKIISHLKEYKNKIPIEVIPCSVDMSLFDPEKIDKEQKLKFQNELQINENDFVISYLGSIGSWYMTDELMQFFKIICSKIPNVKFLFISPNEHSTIKNSAKKTRLSDDKILIKNAARNEVPALLSLSQLSVFFIKPCYSKLSSSPTKHGEIMAMGIPVVTNSGVGDVADIVEKYKSGFVINHFSEDELETVALKISSGISFDKNSIRNAAMEFYNLENAVEKYRKIYEAVLI